MLPTELTKIYRTRAIISGSLNIFMQFFTTVYNQERLILQITNLCTKQENSSKTLAVYNQESGFKSRSGCNGARRVIKLEFSKIILIVNDLDYKKNR